MGLREDIEEGLRKRQQNLIDRVCSYITQELTTDAQTNELHQLLISTYKMGIEALGSGEGTDYKPQEFLEELKRKVNSYLPRREARD